MISTPCPVHPEFWFRSYQPWSHETIFIKQKGLDVIFGRTSHHGRLESDTYAAAVTGARRESGDIFLIPSRPVSLRSQRQLSPRSITRSTFNHQGQANTITAGSLPKIHSKSPGAVCPFAYIFLQWGPGNHSTRTRFFLVRGTRPA